MDGDSRPPAPAIYAYFPARMSRRSPGPLRPGGLGTCPGRPWCIRFCWTYRRPAALSGRPDRARQRFGNASPATLPLWAGHLSWDVVAPQAEVLSGEVCAVSGRTRRGLVLGLVLGLITLVSTGCGLQFGVGTRVNVEAEIKAVLAMWEMAMETENANALASVVASQFTMVDGNSNPVPYTRDEYLSMMQNAWVSMPDVTMDFTNHHLVSSTSTTAVMTVKLTYSEPGGLPVVLDQEYSFVKEGGQWKISQITTTSPEFR